MITVLNEFPDSLDVGTWQLPVQAPRNIHRLDNEDTFDFFAVVNALSQIPNTADTHYDTWLKMGMAMYPFGVAGLAAWEAWSRRSPKYVEGSCESKWDSFDPTEYSGQPVTPRTIFHLAQEFGTPADPMAQIARAMEKWSESLQRPERKQPEIVYEGWGYQEFKRQAFRTNFIVHNVLCEGEPTLLGGGHKMLKTLLMADLGVSVATGADFLGHFKVNEPRVFTMFTGETSPGTLQERINAICLHKDVDPTDKQLQIYKTLPRFDQPLDQFADLLKKLGTQVCAIDPLGRCMNGEYASNLYAMYEQLGNIMDLCAELKITLILAHHSTQSLNHEFRPMELADLTQSGPREAAAQWLLVSRRAAYEMNGYHKLYLNAGGRAGHCGLYHVDVDEGVFDSETQTARYWKPSVKTAADAASESQAVNWGNKVLKLRADAAADPEYREIEWPACRTPILDLFGAKSSNRIPTLKRLLDEGVIGLVPGFTDPFQNGAKFHLLDS